MADRNYWRADHTTQPIEPPPAPPQYPYFVDGPTLTDRVVHQGYTGWNHLGENIAAGNSTADGAFEQWETSTKGHRENMLNANFTHIGIGRAFDSSAQYDWYWTTDFGRGGPTGGSCNYE